MVAQLDNRGGSEHPLVINDKLPMFERVDVTLDKKQIRAIFHWQETGARNVDAVCIFEMFDRCASGSFELWEVWSSRVKRKGRKGVDLNDRMAVISRFGIRYDL